jgi:hypothetical protein
MALKLSGLRAGRPSPPGRFLVLISVKRLSRPHGHSVAGRIKLIKKFNDLIGDRTRNLPACNIVPQPTTLPRGPLSDLSGMVDVIRFETLHTREGDQLFSLIKPLLNYRLIVFDYLISNRCMQHYIYCGIFPQSKIYGAREISVAS